MKIPNKINLLGETFKIRQVSKKDLVCSNCGEDALGILKWEEKTIYLACDDKEHKPLDLLLHELGHYWADYYGLGKNEAWAEAFAKFINSIIKQLELK